MSQRISWPVEWLESTLWFVGVTSINEDTTSQVVNDEGDRLWTCNLRFNIVVRYSPDVKSEIAHMGHPFPTLIGAQSNTVMHCLQAIERIGYVMPDYSYMKIQALREGHLDTPRVSERNARSNQMDVVSVACMIYHSYVYYRYDYTIAI